MLAGDKQPVRGAAAVLDSFSCVQTEKQTNKIPSKESALSRWSCRGQNNLTLAPSGCAHHLEGSRSADCTSSVEWPVVCSRRNDPELRGDENCPVPVGTHPDTHTSLCVCAQPQPCLSWLTHTRSVITVLMTFFHTLTQVRLVRSVCRSGWVQSLTYWGNTRLVYVHSLSAQR